jgi:hypothetical protein
MTNIKMNDRWNDEGCFKGLASEKNYKQNLNLVFWNLTKGHSNGSASEKTMNKTHNLVSWKVDKR